MKDYTLGSVIRSGAWGVLIGGAAGFVLGLMLAPEEGQKIRRRLAYQLEHMGAQVGTLVDKVTRSHAGTDATRSSEAILADVQDRAQRIREDIEALMGEVRRQRVSRSASSNGS